MPLNLNSVVACAATFALLGSSYSLPAKAADLLVAADGSGDYLKVQDAIDAVPKNDRPPWTHPLTDKEAAEYTNDGSIRSAKSSCQLGDSNR